MSDSARPHRRQPTRLCCPWDSLGKNTGVGCHFLLQCIKVKSESEVAQSWPILSHPVDCSLPGSFVHGIFQARVLEWGAIASFGLTIRWSLNSIHRGGQVQYSLSICTWVYVSQALRKFLFLLAKSFLSPNYGIMLDKTFLFQAPSYLQVILCIFWIFLLCFIKYFQKCND